MIPGQHAWMIFTQTWMLHMETAAEVPLLPTAVLKEAARHSHPVLKGAAPPRHPVPDPAVLLLPIKAAAVPMLHL